MTKSGCHNISRTVVPEQQDETVILRISGLWLLLVIFLVGACFVPAELISVATLVCSLFFLADPCIKQKKPHFPGIGPFLAIFAIGMIGAIGKAPYDVFKDIWYVLNPALILFFGCQIAIRQDGLQSVLRAFVAAAVVVSVVHVIQFLLNPSYLSKSLIDIRAQVSPGYLIAALGMGIAIGDMRYRAGVFPVRSSAWLVAILCLLSVSLSFSRALWVIVLTMTGVVLMGANIRKHLLRVVMITSVIMAIAVTAAALFLSKMETVGNETFTDKVVSSLQELRVSDYTDVSDINRNWRGFESYRALQSYVSGTPMNYLLGKGFGTNVDLGFTMVLADEAFDRIPILHNGYLYLLVKTGVAGLGAYLWYLLLVFQSGVRLLRRDGEMSRMAGYLLVASVFIMLETTLVITGMFNKSWMYPATLCIGLLMGYAHVSAERSDVDDTGKTDSSSGRCTSAESGCGTA